MANALWKGGAEAMTIQGQRVITTTGIKCEGNAVMLQGVAYAQPYVISAIGNPAALEAAVLQDDYLAGYRAAAAVPDISVGWDMRGRGADRGAGLRRPHDPAVRRAARLTLAGVSRAPAGRRSVSVGSVGRGRLGRRLGLRGGSSLGLSLGSSKAETTIVTVEPSAAVLAALRALLDHGAARRGGVGASRRHAARSPRRAGSARRAPASGRSRRGPPPGRRSRRS